VYILCGGKSSRMGSDKANYIFKNKTFLDHIITNLDLNKEEVIIVSNHSQHQFKNYTTIKDTKENCGPLAGIIAALEHSNKEINLILSCDIPFINKKSLFFLKNKMINNANINVPRVNDRLMPLVGFYNKKSLNILKEQLGEKELKLMKSLKKLNAHSINIPEEYCRNFSNINSQEDLKYMF